MLRMRWDRPNSGRSNHHCRVCTCDDSRRRAVDKPLAPNSSEGGIRAEVPGACTWGMVARIHYHWRDPNAQRNCPRTVTPSKVVVPNPSRGCDAPDDVPHTGHVAGAPREKGMAFDGNCVDIHCEYDLAQV